MAFEVDADTVRIITRTLGALERKMARSVTPPEGAQAAGKRALELIRSGKAGQGFTDVGRARAAQLARGVALGEDTVRRMHAYFSRHQGDRKPDWGKPGNETPGYVAWQAWGGDAGARWAAAMVRRWDREDGKKEFPPCLPDGSDITSVAQVAALLGVSKKVAAAYVLEEKGISMNLLTEAKGFFPPPDEDSNGIAIMFYPDLDDALQLALEGGTPAAGLHITLGYFGMIGVEDETELEEDLLAITQQIAREIPPFEVNLNGLARFNGGDDDPDTIVVTADSAVLEDARDLLLDLAEDAEVNVMRNHGYTAHMTLGLVDPDSPSPITRWQGRTITISTIVLGFGPKYTHISLGTGETKDVSSASLGRPTTNLTNGAVVVSRLTGRIERIKRRRRKPKDVRVREA